MFYNPKIMAIMKFTGSVLLIMFLGIAVAGAQGVKPVYKVYVDGLSCPFCTYGIEKKFSAVKGVEKIDIDLKTGTTIITMAAGTALDETTARKTVEAAGFALRDFKQVRASPKHKD
ncbi:MAG: heavy-metal-associated domain-containing protein [Nitrospinales bacterium]